MKAQGSTSTIKSWYLLSVLVFLCMGMFALVACSEGVETPWPTPDLPDALPHSMKGYELYSWQAGEGWRFTLITGTNRSKRYDEIVGTSNVVTGTERIRASVEGRENLTVVLERLPAGEAVTWRSGRWLEGTQGAAILLPDRVLVEEIEATCRRLGIQLEIVE
ncbi:MAG: hypothetical protein JXA93_06450 [Anaerolineae bacterium]|nr:hypothetical protein [Anaerolineae bacterium]